MPGQAYDCQVDEEVITPDLQMNLAANEGEPGPEFDQELSDVLDQRRLDLAFVSLGPPP